MRRSFVKKPTHSSVARRGTVSVAVAGGTHVRPEDMARWVFSQSEAASIATRRRQKVSQPVRYDEAVHLSPMTVAMVSPMRAMPRAEYEARLARGRRATEG